MSLIPCSGPALPSSARSSGTLHRSAARVVHRPHTVEQPLPGWTAAVAVTSLLTLPQLGFIHEEAPPRADVSYPTS